MANFIRSTVASLIVPNLGGHITERKGNGMFSYICSLVGLRQEQVQRGIVAWFLGLWKTLENLEREREEREVELKFSILGHLYLGYGEGIL